ncbi:MAG: HEAT repeat domain-containing protein, partial [Candidatus Jordarchaeum sp.]|uniref:HEAT repeat domain-containing protein n=1 Tax=Candidatus Jordarchaeum sp. TaxID=2823881 RepID=UPI004049E0C6
MNALEESPYMVRYKIIHALKELGDERAVKPILRQLFDDPDMEDPVMIAILDICGENAQEIIIPALKDEDEYVRMGAVWVL